jgi:hypothetical protein
MDENDLWSIVLVKPCTHYQKANREQNGIICKAQTELGAIITEGLQATIGSRPSCFEKWSNIGWMKMIHG